MTLQLTEGDAQRQGLPAIDRALRKLLFRGLFTISLFIASFAVWSVAVALVGAVAASGQFVVAGDVKKVQHMTGGVVGELLVREGDRVEAGDTLLRLDPTLLTASRDIVSKQLDEAAVQEARLTAELNGRTSFEVPARLAARMGDKAVADLVASERRLLESRISALAGREAQLRKRIEQANEEIVGLESQLAAKKVEIGILTSEIKTVRGLYAKKLVQYVRLSTIEREGARIEGQLGQIVSMIAGTRGKISEIELQIIQLDEDQREQSTTELRELQAKNGELAERLVAAEDQLKRIDLRAPASGTVHQLALHTVGGVLTPGETAMTIVPSNEVLELETRIAPTDVDQVTVGQLARVKLRAGNQRMTPELVGHVSRVGADSRIDERTGAAFYSVRVVVPPDELKHAEPLKVIAGMQAEVFIETSERTPLDFLLKPLTEQISRTFIDR